MLTWMINYLQETVLRPQHLYTEPAKCPKMELNTLKRTRLGSLVKCRKDTQAERKIANLLENGVRMCTILRWIMGCPWGYSLL